MEKSTIDQFVERIHALLGETLGITGRSLEKRVRRAGRSLPKPVRLAAEELVAAQRMSQEPKLLMKLDADQVTAAFETCKTHLEQIDSAALRAQARFSLAATVIVQMFAVAAALLAVLRWRGFV